MAKNLEIIGLGGTNGSGKDTVGNILAEKHGYLFISGSELLREEAKKRGLPVAREFLRPIGAEWRRELGLGVIVDRAVAEYEKHKDKYTGLVLASLRNPGEADRIHELGGTVVWLDADPRVRYDRIQANASVRNRQGEDDKTFEQFLSEEEDEMHAPADGDSTSLDGSAVKERSDVFIMNDTDNLNSFQLTIEKALGLEQA